MNEIKNISGKIVDVVNREIYEGTLLIENGIIKEIKREALDSDKYIMPGFVDAHVHIESSMVIPYEFAKIALRHGTVATVSDPHEIANVMGLEGVYYMLENANGAHLKFNFGAPSCVPATSFETAGAILDVKEVDELLKRDDIKYLSEMMNYPGVLFKDKMVMEKIASAKKYNKPIDGHAPGLMGEDARKYIESGISTDHECFTLDEALNKLKYGMKILIREGSAAKNFDALYTLIDSHTNETMLCSDDKHPDDLMEGHINLLVKRAVAKGMDLMNVLTCACVNPVKHYGLDVGLLQEGDKADFIVLGDLEKLNVEQTVIDGNSVFENDIVHLANRKSPVINQFNCSLKTVSDFKTELKGYKVQVIEALDGQLITNKLWIDFTGEEKLVEQDVLKMTVVNRYSDKKPAIAFAKNFGLKNAAIASSVAHDSHNIIAVGSSDELICNAVNEVIKNKGGLSVVSNSESKSLALPVAGLMSDKPCNIVGELYAELDALAKQSGSTLRAPYMTLSFMALLVIPKLKLSDKGLFDAEKFEFTPLTLQSDRSLP